MVGYDQVSRLRSITDAGNNSATYSYLANSPLVGQIVFAQSGSTRMITTKQYDDLNRLTQISSQPSAGGSLPFTYNYNYNSANQRTKDTLADGSYWTYGYDALGQVTNGTKYFASGTPVATTALNGGVWFICISIIRPFKLSKSQLGQTINILY